jgi:hypothetical protein
MRTGRLKKIKIKIKIKIWYPFAGKDRKKIFGFRFSIPKIPKLPKLPKLPELPELPDINEGTTHRSCIGKKFGDVTLYHLLHCPFSEGHLKPSINATSQKYPIPTKIRNTKFKNKKIGIFIFKVRLRLCDPLRHQPNDPLTFQSLKTKAAQHAQRNTVYILNHKMCVGIQLRQKIVVLLLELPDRQKTILRLFKVKYQLQKKQPN